MFIVTSYLYQNTQIQQNLHLIEPLFNRFINLLQQDFQTKSHKIDKKCLQFQFKTQ